MIGKPSKVSPQTYQLHKYAPDGGWSHKCEILLAKKSAYNLLCDKNFLMKLFFLLFNMSAIPQKYKYTKRNPKMYQKR